MLGRHEPAVPRDYSATCIDQQRHDKAKTSDAARDLVDLPRTMAAGIFRIELQLGDRPVDDRESASITGG